MADYSLSPPLWLFAIPRGGALRDPPNCFVWMTLKDNGGLEPWPALGVCANLRLSIGSAVLLCQERLCDLCVTERGVSTAARASASRGGVYIASLRVHTATGI